MKEKIINMLDEEIRTCMRVIELACDNLDTDLTDSEIEAQLTLETLQHIKKKIEEMEE